MSFAVKDILAKNRGKTLCIGNNVHVGNNLQIGDLVKIKDDPKAFPWLRESTLLFLGYQRFYERSREWKWDSKWGWDNGATTHLIISHQMWLLDDQIILIDIGSDLYDTISKSSKSGNSDNKHMTVKWVKPDWSSNKNSNSWENQLIDLLPEEIAFEENSSYRKEKLLQREDLFKLETGWLKTALPADNRGRTNFGYGKRLEDLEKENTEFKSFLFRKNKSKIISWVNWNPKWSPSNAILRNFADKAQQEEFREDLRLWLIELEGNDLKKWE